MFVCVTPFAHRVHRFPYLFIVPGAHACVLLLYIYTYTLRSIISLYIIHHRQPSTYHYSFDVLLKLLAVPSPERQVVHCQKLQ
jgi:hypothetical protein